MGKEDLKKSIEEEIFSVYIDLYGGDFDEEINKLIEKKKEFEEKDYFEFKFMGYSWDEDRVPVVFAKCMETDKEFEKRLKRRKSARKTTIKCKAAKLEADWKQYEKLKKQFEK